MRDSTVLPHGWPAALRAGASLVLRGGAVLALATTLLSSVGARAQAEPGAEATAPVTGTLIVLNKSDATASFINPISGETVGTVSTGTGPHEVAVSPDGRLAVIADYGERTPGNTLTLIDVPGRRVLKTVDLGEHRRPHGIAFLRDGKRVVVTTEEAHTTVLVDLETDRVSRSIATGQEISHMVALSPDETRAFVANIGSGSVSVLDLESGERVAVVPTGTGAEGIDVTPDGEQVWITNRGANTVSVLDARSLEIVDTLPCSNFPIRVKITPDGEHALVSNARSGDVAVFEVAGRKEVQRISMDVQPDENLDGRLFGDAFEGSPVPIGILVQPDGKRAYVANTYADIITVIDLETWAIVGRIAAGTEPDGLGWSALAPN